MEDTGIGDAAYAMSYNGIRLGGTSTTNEAWIWDPIAGGRSVKTYLVDELGLTEANGWQLERITAFSSDGTVAVGWGTNPSGNTEGWVAVIPEISILRGDFDLDGVLDPNDVASFTATVADPCGSSVQDRYFADMNDDRFVNGTDVVLFTSSLLQN